MYKYIQTTSYCKIQQLTVKLQQVTVNYFAAEWRKARTGFPFFVRPVQGVFYVQWRQKVTIPFLFQVTLALQ